jgi:prepilin-type N-terminal cleavage/methylation domain-containing protein
MKKRTKRDSRGFTLIEVIITIVIVAILGTFLVSYMSGGITKSSIPVIWVKQEFNLFETMEKITVDYQKAVSSTSFASSELDTFRSAITPPQGMTVTPDYINIARGDGTLTTEDSTTGLILRVKLQKGDQSVTALFTR